MESILSRPVLDIYPNTALCDFLMRALFLIFITPLHLGRFENLSTVLFFNSLHLMLVGFATGNKSGLIPTKVSELMSSKAHHSWFWQIISRFPDLQEPFDEEAAPPIIT